MNFVVANRPEAWGAMRAAWWIHKGLLYPYEAFDFGDRLISCGILGAVCLKLNPGLATVQWDLDDADSDSLHMALRIIERSPLSPPVLLNFRKQAWASERHSTAASARARIDELQAMRDVCLPPITTIRRMELDSLDAAESPLRQAMATWTKSRDVTDWPSSSPLDSALILMRDEDGFRFTHIGVRSAAVQRAGMKWRAAAIGRQPDDLIPDDRFNKRVNQNYDTAIETGEPIFDHVLAHVSIAGRDAEWLRYQRLTLPTRSGIAVFAAVTPSLSIPFLSAA